jgi:hypothetical protein
MAAGQKTAGASAPARRKASANGNGNGSGGKSKAKAAVEEVVKPDAVEQKVAEFRGRKLRLKELPPTFLWDLSAAGNSIPAYYQLIQQVLEPEAFAEVRDARAEFEGDDDDFSDELFEAVFAQYGLGVGESAASQDS